MGEGGKKGIGVGMGNMNDCELCVCVGGRGSRVFASFEVFENMRSSVLQGATQFPARGGVG